MVMRFGGEEDDLTAAASPLEGVVAMLLSEFFCFM